MRYVSNETPRRRALIVSYACDPNRGSEAGGGWNRVVQLARHFDATVICEEREFGGPVRDYLREHGEIPGLEFHFLPQWPWESMLWLLPGLGYAAYNLWQRRAFKLARRLHRQHPFDVVHQLAFGTFREPGYLWKLDAPMVWGPFGGTQNFPWRYLASAGLVDGALELARSLCNWAQLHGSWRVGRAARRAAALLAANSTTQRDLQRVHGVQSQLFADTGIAQVLDMPRTESRGGPLRVLWSGHHIPRKALNLLIEALARLPKDVACEVQVVGDGRCRRAWQRLAARRGVGHRITWAGWIPHREMIERYRWADVFVFTSLRDNLGTVLLEAMGAGLPIVCLDHQGAHDVVTDECGIKIPLTRPADTIARLAAALERLAADGELRLNMGRAAIARAGDFLWSRHGEEIAKVYGQVMERRDSADGETNGSSAGRVGKPVAQERTTHLRRRLALRLTAPLSRISRAPAAGKFGILLYHRIASDATAAHLPPDTIHRSLFRRQLQGLLARGYTPWPLRRAIEQHRRGQPLPPRTFVVTMDDGCECLYDEAWPVLRELNVPATIFLVTSFLDKPQDFNFATPIPRETAGAHAPLMQSLSAAQCVEMGAGGLVEFGTHTHTHADFRGRAEVFGADLRTSLDVLQHRFGISEPALAYPFGHAGAELAAEARRSGVACALTTHHELVGPRSDPFALGRFVVEPYDTAATLAARLDGWYSVFQDAWHRLRGWSARSVTECR